MSEQPATYSPDTITPAIVQQRASDELSALHDLLAQAKGAADTLSPEAEAALEAAFIAAPMFRRLLNLLIDDVDGARKLAAGRVDAELRKENGR